MNSELERVVKKMGLSEDSELGLPIHAKTTLPVTLWYDHSKELLILLDQNKLPYEVTTWKTLDWKEGAIKGIKEMIVRGSQAIGVAGAYCVLLAACHFSRESDFLEKLIEAANFIGNVRPTAAPLSWATGECILAAKKAFEEGFGPSEIVESVRNRADQIMAYDLILNYYLRKEGMKLLKGGDVIMTHCNGGSLSSTLMGHALGIIEEAYVNGLDLMVVSKETRPRSQGYRLTVWELNRAGVPVTIVTDNMISISMERMGINMVLLGADRVAADGSVANKVGSADIARIAKDYNVPFYFATSYTTISPEITDGNSIPIEERSIDEITEPYRLLAKELKESNKISSSALDEWPPTTCLSEKKPMRGQVRLYNPAFDITPPNLIRGIVTDLGLFQPKEISNLTREKMALLARERISNFLT